MYSFYFRKIRSVTIFTWVLLVGVVFFSGLSQEVKDIIGQINLYIFLVILTSHLYLKLKIVAKFIDIIIDGFYLCFGKFIPKPSVTKDEHISKSNKGDVFEVSNIKIVKLGNLSSNALGDFIDNVESSNIFYIAEVKSKKVSYVVYNDILGTHSLNYGVFLEGAIKISINKCPHLTSVTNLYSALAMSTIEQDSDRLFEIDPKYEKNFFHASETDDVEQFAPCIFGVGSRITEKNIYISAIDGTVKYGNQTIPNLAEFYGMVDEDAVWVVGSKL